MPLSFSSPLSLYSIPVAYFLSFYPMTMKFFLIDRTIGYNNVQPRANTAKLVQNKDVARQIAARAERMEGAHLNGNEAMPLWIAAVLAGNYAGLDNQTLNEFSIVYIALRLCYNQIYINHETDGKSWFRSLIFFTGASLPLTLLFKAANKVASE